MNPFEKFSKAIAFVLFMNVAFTAFSQSGHIPYSVTQKALPVVISVSGPGWACEGNPVQFVVTATGDSLAFQWYFEGIPINNSDNDTLLINNVSVLDAGSYFCIVSNCAGSDTSDTVLLLVYQAGVTFTDTINNILHDGRDCQNYPILKIGTQWWMSENLNVGTMVTSNMGSEHSDQFDNSVIEKYCYENDPNNCVAFGGLYEWGELMQYAASDTTQATTVQGVCPNGWHLPNDNEWKTLELFLGMSQSQADSTDARGTDQGAQLKAGGASGFNGLYGGYRGYDGSFNFGGYGGLWWSATSVDSTHAWDRDVRDFTSQVYRTAHFKLNGFAARCIKNNCSDISVSNTISICEGQSYTVGTHTYSTSGTYHDTIQFTGGCDSIITTTLTINPLPANINDTVSVIYYQQDFSANPNFTSLSPTHTQWDSINGNYFVNTYDDQTDKYWAWSPQFTNADSTKDMILKMDLNFVHSVFGTYPGVRGYKQNYADPLPGITPAFTISSTGTVRKFMFSDYVSHSYQLNNVFSDSVWYRVEIHYNASAHKADIYITNATTGSAFDQVLNADFVMGNFSYIGVGFYDIPDYGNDWAPVRIDNILAKGFMGKLEMIAANDTICSGSNTQFSINNSQPGVSYQLSVNGNQYGGAQVGNGYTSTFVIQYSIFNIGNNTITISATDTATACSIVLDTVLHVIVNPIYSISESVAICSGQSYTVDTHTYTTSGTYNDTLHTTTFGCDSIIITNLTVNPLPIVDAGYNQIIVYGSFTNLNATVSGGSGSFLYSWTPAASLFVSTIEDPTTIGLIETTVFTLLVTDSVTGCQSSDQLTIIVTCCLFSANASATPNTVCSGSSVQLNANASGGSTNYNYSWSSNPAGFISTIENPIVSPTITTIYTVTVNDGFSNVTSSVTVTVNPLPVVNLGNDTAICTNASITLTAGGSGNYYQWNNGLNSSSITVSTSGNFAVTVTNAYGCSASDNITLSVYSSIDITINVVNTTCGQHTGSATATVTGGTSPYQYLWSMGDTVNIADSLAAGVYILYVSDANQCQNSAPAVISSTNGANITNVQVTPVSCSGGSDGAISVTVTGGTQPYQLEWSNGDTLNQNIGSLTAGPYEIVVTDANNCQAVQSINVAQPAQLEITFTIINASCGNADGSITTTVSGGTVPYIYNWSTGAPTQNLTSLGAGIYSITITDAHACTAAATAAISESGSAIITIDSIVNPICNGINGGIYISVSGGTNFTYNWSDSTHNQDLTGVQAGDYNVTVTSGGCNAVSYATISEIQPVLQPICIVSVDVIGNASKNMVVWEKQQTAGISHYKFWKETTQAGVYHVVAAIPYAIMSKWTDPLSNPHQRAWRYKISAVDSCGTESPFSAVHKTIHLTVNLGQGQDINLIWNHYQGFEYYTYYIYRYQPSSGWITLDSIPGDLNTFTDTPTGGGVVRYQISAKRLSDCWSSGDAKDMGGPFSQSLSNIEDNGIIEVSVPENILNGDFKIYPNPVKNELTIEIQNSNSHISTTLNVTGNSKFEIINMIGQSVYTSYVEKKITIDVSPFPSGVYFVKLFNDKTIGIKKFVKE